MAAEEGAIVNAGAQAALMKDGNKITGVELVDHDSSVHKIKSKIVVAADGVESLIARQAGFKSNFNTASYITGIQFEMTNIKFHNPKMLEVYLGKNVAPGGYAWIFPKGPNSANVGLGIRASSSGVALNYLKDTKLLEIDEILVFFVF